MRGNGGSDQGAGSGCCCRPGRAAEVLPVTRVGAGDSEAETEGWLDAKKGGHEDVVVNDVVKPELPVSSIGERASEAETEGLPDANEGVTRARSQS